MANPRPEKVSANDKTYETTSRLATSAGSLTSVRNVAPWRKLGTPWGCTCTLTTKDENEQPDNPQQKGSILSGQATASCVGSEFHSLSTKETKLTRLQKPLTNNQKLRLKKKLLSHTSLSFYKATGQVFCDHCDKSFIAKYVHTIFSHSSRNTVFIRCAS